MNTGDIAALVVAICLVPLGGIFAAVDSALARVSVARVDEFVREGRAGAGALRAVCENRARYTNLLLMLRLTCELSATVLVTIAARAQFGGGWEVPLLEVTARLRCSNCYAKDCEIQVDRLVPPGSVPKRLL